MHSSAETLTHAHPNRPVHASGTDKKTRVDVLNTSLHTLWLVREETLIISSDETERGGIKGCKRKGWKERAEEDGEHRLWDEEKSKGKERWRKNERQSLEMERCEEVEKDTGQNGRWKQKKGR